MNPNVSYNPNVEQTNQSALAYTTSGNELSLLANRDIFHGMTKKEKAEAKAMLEMIVFDMKDLVERRMRGSSNVRY